MHNMFYVGIKGLIIDGNKALMLKGKDHTKKTFYWDLPGGRMQDNENIADTLIRELSEEIPTIQGIQIHDLIFAHKLPHSLSDGQGLILLIYRVSAHLPTVTLSYEHSEYKWVRKNELEVIEQEGHLNPEYRKLLYQNLSN